MSKCSWCGCLEDIHKEFCNECNFCQTPICCDCWDGDLTCYQPGDGWCPKCREKRLKCDICIKYLDSWEEASICKKHWN